jgi:hypothetical protein
MAVHPLLLLLGVFVLAGCVQPAQAGFPVVEVVERFAWEGDPQAGLQQGDHCVFTRWQDDGLHLDRHIPLADGLVVRRYNPAEFAGSRLSPTYIGGDELGDVARDLQQGQPFLLNQSFAVGTLATLQWDGHALFVDGRPVPLGGERTVSASEEVAGGVVHEEATVRLHRDVPVVLEPRPTFCD